MPISTNISKLILVGILLYSADVFASGITIPANCTLDVSSCSVIVPGDVTNAGTLKTSTGSITLSGNWLSSGVFTSGTGTVTFNADAGIQTLTTGGVANAFYNLTHNAAGTVQLATNLIDINNNFSNTAGTFVTSSLNMTVGNDWTNSATFTGGTSTVTLDGGNQAMSGSSTFYNLVKQVSAPFTLTFSADGADETTVTHKITLQGAVGNLLSLEKAGANSQAKLKLQAGGAQAFGYLSVHNNIATGLTLVAGATSTDAGNTTNWSFSASTMTWDGSESTDWDDPFNWDLGLVPAPGDTAIVPPLSGSVLFQPTLSSNVIVGNLTIQANAVVTLNGNNLTVSSTFANSGNLKLKGSETLNLTQDTDSGTFTYVGGTGVPVTVKDFGATDYYNLVINDTGGSPDTFTTNGALTLANNLNVTGGTLNISTNSNALTVPGTLTVDGGTLTATNSTIDTVGVAVSAGTFTAPSSTANTAFTVSGNWNKTGGTFTANGGKVTFDGTGQSITGSTTFYQLRKVVAAADTLTFGAGDTQTVTGNLTLSGAAAPNLLSLRSSATPTQANLNLQAGVGATQAITFVDVKDNNAGGLELVARSSSVDSGHNTNWAFGATTITWTGAVSTDWSDPANWDKGLVPGTVDTAVIADTSSTTNRQPILSVAVDVTNLTVQSNATLTLNGKNLTVTNILSNDGTVSLEGSETVEIKTADANSGTFTYTGTGGAGPFTVQITDPTTHAILATEFYNLTIADTSGAGTFVRTADLSVAGSVTVSGGTFDITTNSKALAVAGTLTVSGTGVLAAGNGTIDANIVTITGGTLTAPSSTSNTAFTVSGDFSHSGGTFTANGGKVTLDGGNQTLSGNTTFYRLRKTTTVGDTLTFTAGDTQTVTNDLTLTGILGQELKIRSSASPTRGKITLQPGGTQAITHVDVQDSDASGGLTLVDRDGINSGNNIHWVLNAATMTWTGTTSTDWDTQSNWDLGVVPINLDTVIIPDTTSTTNRQPVLAVDQTVANLTLQDAASTLTSNGNDLTVTNLLTNNGILYFKGNETVEIKTIDADSGTFTYTGTGGAGPFTVQVTDPTTHAILATEFYNLTIADATNLGTFVRTADLGLPGALTITGGNFDISTNARTLTTTGNIAVSGGTLTATNGNIDANASVSIAGTGTLVAPGTAKSFTIAGDFSHASGTFTHSNGRVTLDTAAAVTITGNTTFYDLYATTGDKQLNFTAGSTQTVSHLLNFVGTTGHLVTLRSATTGSKWGITFPNSVQAASLLDVKDSDANTNTITCYNCTDSGNNNANWIFVVLRIGAPADQRTVGQTPTIIGQTAPNTNVRIKGRDTSGAEVVVATARSDANGNFRVVLGNDDDTDAGTTVTAGVKLKLSSAAFDNYLTPYILNPFGDEVAGLQNNLTVVAAPTSSQVPQISSPANGAHIKGAKPTITGVAQPGQSVAVVANDAAGNLLLATVGSGTADGSGNYSFALTTALPKGTVYLSVTVDQVASSLITVTLTDPFGTVFDSSSDKAINNASVAIYRASDHQLAEKSICDSNGNITTVKDLACDDTNPYVTGADGTYGFLAADGDYYIVVSATGYDYPSKLTTFPGDRTVATGSKGEQFTVASVVLQIDHPLDGNGFLLRIEKDANKSEVKVGDVETYTVKIENLSVDNVVNGVLLEDNIPPGFKYLPNRVLLDGVPLSEPSGNRPLVFSIGTVPAGGTKTLRYQLVVGTGVIPGTYENVAKARYANGVVISNFGTKSVKVVVDPLFDLGSVIGKVFYDLNENGVQDGPEYDATEGTTIVERPVPNVQVVSEDGMVITTDRNGQFNVPGILPGRHILRLDERSLPPGAFLTTDKAVVIDVTQGSITKVNFGVNMDNTQVVGKDARFFNEKIALTQDRNRPAPRLNAALFTPSPPTPGAEELLMYNGALVHPAEFRIFTNYTPFVDHWQMDIIDRDTRKLVKRFEGTRFNMQDPVFWNGSGDDEKTIQPEHKYAYVLTATDAQGKHDITREKPLAVRVLGTEDQYKQEQQKDTDKDALKARADDYRKWAQAQMAVSTIERQGIAVQGETVHIARQGQDIKTVRIFKDGALFAEVPVEQYDGLTPQELLAAGMSTQPPPDNLEFVLPNGDYTLEVVAPGAPSATGQVPVLSPPATAPPRGAVQPASGLERYSRQMKVGDDYFMFVGMGDGQVGYTFNRGNIEPVAQNDKFQHGFWQEGKLAYYLKGKIKGKYLVTSSFDVDRQQKELYRHLDPETYYPMYGDKSSINYDATNTQGPLYLLVEWDKSSAIWGNYAVDFKDTEFAAFSRSYYGGKLDYQSVATNPYGDARTKVVLFHAEIHQRPAHNEFLGTGGSLYFLKDKSIVQGSDQIKLEVRDRVTGLVLASKDMKNGADYELDEGQGRILFWQPVAMIAKSESIVASSLLDGNPVYVVADYQYLVKDQIRESSQGARVAQAVGDNVVVGGTYVKEVQADRDYNLQGADVTAHLGPDATLKAEYAQTKSIGTSSYVSTDGGITFTQLQVGNAASGKAYGIKEDARLFNRLGISSYYKWIEDSFTSPGSSSQQGKELAGMSLTFDLTPVTRLTASQDIQRLINNGNLQTQAQVGAQETSTTMVQIMHESERLKLTGAYQLQSVTSRIGDLVTNTNQVSRTLAGRADYVLNGRVTLSLGQQFDIANKNNNITTLGVQARLFNNLMLRAQEAFSPEGTATTAGLTANVTDKLALLTDYTVAQKNTGEMIKTTSIGVQEKLNDKISAGATVAMNDSSTGGKTVTSSLTTKAQLTKDTSIDAAIGKTQSPFGQPMTATSLSATTSLNPDQDSSLKATAGIKNDGTGNVKAVTLEAANKVNERTDVTSTAQVSEDAAGARTSSVTLGERTKINDQLQAVSERTFGKTNDAVTSGNKYSLVRDANGRKLEGSFARELADSQANGVSQSNIFGLSGDVNDKLALQASIGKGEVQNLDGSRTNRLVYSFGSGYVLKDTETAVERLKDSAKAELRLDNGMANVTDPTTGVVTSVPSRTWQYVFYNALEGKLTDNLSVSAKIDYSKTVNTTTNLVQERHKEILLGVAYRPVNFDRLNLIAQYSYKENQGPVGQNPGATLDVEKNRAQVYSAEAVLDIDENWQLAEKFAYRINDEKVTGFEFNRTHTWLMVHRLNYKLDRNWTVSGEYRKLTQVEAHDSKSGLLLEATRNINDNTQLGIGWNFTEFNDDLTNLSFTSQGPFLRMTGKFYDRTPEEKARARAKWLDERVNEWAWIMVRKELSKPGSKLVVDFNRMYALAQGAQKAGRYEESQQIYKDIIVAGQMMFDEASQYIRTQIAFEEKLQEYSKTAEEYARTGEYIKARKLWEKVVEGAQKRVIQ